MPLDQTFFGFNLLSLAGFVLMGLGLGLQRGRRARAGVWYALMTAGTALVVWGLYAGGAMR